MADRVFCFYCGKATTPGRLGADRRCKAAKACESRRAAWLRGFNSRPRRS